MKPLVPVLGFLLCVLVAAPPSPAVAQVGVDDDRLRELLYTLIERVGEEELAFVVAAGERAEELQDEDLADLMEARERLRAVLDTVVFRTTWGGEELARLRARFPASDLFLRYDARLAHRTGEHERALSAYDELVDRFPREARLHAARASVLLAVSRAEDAVLSLTRALDLDPADQDVYRELVRMHRARGTLHALLDQVERHRRIHPGLDVLRQREAELRHRLDAPPDSTSVPRFSEETR